MYFVSGMLGRIMEPTAALQLVFVSSYFIGVPVIIAWILTEERRSPWGAIASFPLMYVRTWSFGFLKYDMSAPFFLLTIYSFVRLFREDRITWKSVAFYAVSVWCLYTSHTQAYAFAGFILGVLWFGFFLHRLTFVLRPATPEHQTGFDFFRRTVYGLAASLPSIYAYTLWFKDTQTRLGNLADTTGLKDYMLTGTEEKLRVMMLLLALTKDPNEWDQVVLLFVVVGFCAVVRRFGSNDRSPIPEAIFAITFVSQFILPGTVHGQMIGQRHMDASLWLLPLVITPALWKKNKLAFLAGTLALLYYSKTRLEFLWVKLEALNKVDLAGLDTVVQFAPEGPYRITQVTFGEHSTPHWQAYTLDQQFAYVAARKGYDAPIYDTRIRAMEVRYKDAPPSPPTLVFNDYYWWKRSDIWQNFDLVLTYKFAPARETRIEMDDYTSSVGRAGDWELWKRRDLK
jgi:hypothetical protein